VYGGTKATLLLLAYLLLLKFLLVMVLKGDFLFFMYVIQHCFICRPSVGGCWDRPQAFCDFCIDSTQHFVDGHPAVAVALFLN
jgi:hypothetical protein